ncbi:undecaprenyl-diphosphate phosphatase [bacterium]|nr:MAG: undecaprenyl-diphosphate phosphatase [bacterium]
MGLIEAILYGLVQGITEWLPISSTAHLRILPVILGQPDPGAAFTAVIQLGTTLAVIIFFAKDLGGAIKAWFNSLRGVGKDTVEAKLAWGVFYGTLPIMLIGFLFKSVIKSDEFRSLYVIATTLILNGILMAVAERVRRKRRSIEEVTVRDGIVVGLWQALALVPGMSRSGSTIAGGLFTGLDRTTAARFSFLMSVPSIAAAGFYELYQERAHILGSQLMPTIVATVVSFVVGYASIAWLIKYIAKQGFTVFVIYRIVLGLLLLSLIAAGRIAPVSMSPDRAKVETPVR